MVLVAPRELRETIDLLGSIDEKGGLDKLIDEIDWSGVTPRQVYLAVLDRLPESIAAATAQPGYLPQRQFRAAVRSQEFQRNFLARALHALPEKRRLIFVHVPKCAGTDLIQNLSANLPWLHEHMFKPEWTNSEKFLRDIREFAIRARQSEAIFVSGHTPLKWYVDNRLCRFNDRIFAVVRPPLEVAVSYCNYVIKRFFEDPEFKWPDTRGWANLLGIQKFDPGMPPDQLHALALRAVTTPGMVEANPLCKYLGSWNAESAIDLIVRSNIEITDIARYRRWLHESWQIDSNTQINKSPSVIALEDLSRNQLNFISDLFGQDLRLYDKIASALRQGDGTAIFGGQLS